MNGPPPRLTVAHAAAGCGKTTDLARTYLDYLSAGLQVHEVIAITFTRRAAAELQERVALALRAARPGPAGEAARAKLGDSWQLYEPHAPQDPAAVERALAQLPDAPIGTTDAFVQRLLTELAVHAALPVAPDHAVPLDVPIRPGTGVAAALDRAARRLLDPPDGGVDPDVSALLPYLTLDDIRAAVVRRSPIDHLEPAPATEVLALVARDLARVCARHDLVALYQPTDPASPTAWAEALLPKTNNAGRWAVPAVAPWFADGAPLDSPPYELTGWLLGLRRRSRAEKALHADLTKHYRDFGMARLSLWEVVEALEYPYDEVGHVELADEIRRRVHRVRQRVLRAGLEHAALAGTLGYDELLDAAIRLCQHPPPRLHGRFRALMVDEVQDASPSQYRFYRALADLPGEHPVSAYFVGDARQSIYLFRHAEPQGLRDLQQQALQPGNRSIELETNHRSAPRLVEAQRELFGVLDEPMRGEGWSPPAPLAGLAWQPANANLALDPAHHDPPEPVWLIRGHDLRAAEASAVALHAFLGRVRAAWRESDHEHDTAVVLAPTWRAARAACHQLRQAAGRDDIAWVDGSNRIGASRVGTDIAVLLRALADPSDDIAWLGVWKHPSVGISDGGLARIRAGAGLSIDTPEGPAPAPRWARRLGRVLEADQLGPPHIEEDQEAFSRARAPLRAARAALGRTDLAEVVDILASALNWRGALLAGPGGADDLAQFEVLLDWLRTLGGEGVPVSDILTLMQEPEGEAPRVHLERPGQHVLCTTVHQAKGLAWDHVCVLEPGSGPKGGRSTEPAWMSLTDQRRCRLEGVAFDPYGGITSFADPIGRLARKLHDHRRVEESARTLYVAVTRARRTVTLSPTTRRHRGGGREKTTVATIVRDQWLAHAERMAGVACIEAGPPPELPSPPSGWVQVRTTPPPTWSHPTPPPGHAERTPSSMGGHLSTEDRRLLAEGIAARIRLANGLHIGAARPVSPPGTHPSTGEPIAGHRLAHLRPSDWGDLAHGWLASWKFAGEPSIGAVQAWLEQEWEHADPEVGTWLMAVCERLRSAGGPLWDLVTRPGATLHFELPLVGVASQQDRSVLLSGRSDLLVDHGQKRVSVIDFKAGAVLPTGWHDLADRASLRTYAPQLEAYAEAYRAMDYTVEEVALWFVRTGTSVRWSV